MDKNKNQAINFAYEVLPIMFHSQTDDFFTYLERDGRKFLDFWWNYIGEKLPEDQLCSSAGLGGKVMELEPGVRLAVVTLPQPKADDEIYYLAMVAKPEKRFAWVRLPTTNVIALVRKSGEEYPNGTEIGEITPRGRYVAGRSGPVPSPEAMIKLARKAAIKPKKS